MFSIPYLNALRAAEIERVAAWFQPGGHVLELGAGTGQQAHELTRLGFAVEAIELADSHYAGDRIFPIVDNTATASAAMSSQRRGRFDRTGGATISARTASKSCARRQRACSIPATWFSGPAGRWSAARLARTLGSATHIFELRVAGDTAPAKISLASVAHERGEAR